LVDVANAVRFAQNGTKEQFSNYVHDILKMAG